MNDNMKTFASADEAFDHLQELVDALPRMQEQGSRLSVVRSAREALGIARKLSFDKDALADLDRRRDEAAEAAARARAEGRDEEDLQQLDEALLYFGAMRGFKIGPVLNGEKALSEALAAGGFVDVDAAISAALSDEEFQALEGEVTDYQADYASTLAYCQELEGDGEE